MLFLFAPTMSSTTPLIAWMRTIEVSLFNSFAAGFLSTVESPPPK